MRWTRAGLHQGLSQGLYSPSFEKDACGIGMVAHIQGKKSHTNVADTLQLLAGLKHRGAQGADAESGDGCGILTQIPHLFFKRELASQKIKLGNAGSYAVGMIFLPADEGIASALRQRISAAVVSEGLNFLAWRRVPVLPSSVGPSARKSLPQIWQFFIDATELMTSPLRLDQKLYAFRRGIEKKFRAISIPSLSARTIVYKGLILPERLADFYPDLIHPKFESAISIVHSRFSTNTFPTWSLAHPYRYLCHNGEINTLKGNLNWMRVREGALPARVFGRAKTDFFPLIETDQSDSACLDNAFEFLLLSGKSIAEAMMTLVPEPWGAHTQLAPELNDFYRSRAAVMEPWDGPAALCFTDGNVAGASLDRNGLRPCRYVITEDQRLILASEGGALALRPDEVVATGRLEPGKMLLVDTLEGIFLNDDEVKNRVIAATTSTPRDLSLLEFAKRSPLKDLDTPRNSRISESDLLQQQIVFGYSEEEIVKVLKPMAVTGEEPISSMGWDAPLAVLSRQPQLLFNYFKQLFAQVTNPPIDPIREESVMSLVSFVGAREEQASRIQLTSPVLSTSDFQLLQARSARVLLALQEGGLEKSLLRICEEVEALIDQGSQFIILSDRNLDSQLLPIPSLLAIGAVHVHLIKKSKRHRASLIVDTGEAREVHHIACLAGYGAEAIHPYVAFEVAQSFHALGEKNLLKAMNKGLLKIFSKMGISTFQSYCGAQLFEALGIGSDVIQRCFDQTASRIGGIGFVEIEQELYARAKKLDATELNLGGEIHYRSGSEAHGWSPQAIYKLQHASRQGNTREYQAYADFVNEQAELVSLRQLLDFDFAIDSSACNRVQTIPLEQVEPAQQIVKRFTTGAMSLGAINTEAHESLAVAMNRIGAKSNTGEGGEDPARFQKRANGDSTNSAIKQVASGRFGVTAHYLVNAQEIQIKMAQGAKPGEGGQLPGHKVNAQIAKLRHSVPGVQLISPPPHHDIYSIEDLAQLIFDLKNVNPTADISVKLVSEVGVGTIAAGVVKAKADKILISGDSGGTGASPLSSIRHAGAPWEIGLAETHQTLVLNGLRSRVRIETDGQLRTGRDVVIAALLGAEEFGFATAPLIVQGCIMMRKCHLNTCPVGIATQDPELRKLFSGKPEYVVNYLFFVAEEVRQWMAKLGFKSLNEVVGRVDRLRVKTLADHPKAASLDLSLLLHHQLTHGDQVLDDPLPSFAEKEKQDHQIDSVLDRDWINQIPHEVSLMGLAPRQISIRGEIANSNRSAGAMLSGEMVKRFGAEGLPESAVKIDLTGIAGQSFGAFLCGGIELNLSGQGNDYVGKGLSGGILSIRDNFKKSDPAARWIVAGNTAFYGATSGKGFIAGKAGERFAVRNSGAQIVVEGLGDHGCEYMTGGVVAVLGKTGKNFGAGMSGGIAFVLDRDASLVGRCNMAMIEVTPLICIPEKNSQKVEGPESLDCSNSLESLDALDSLDTLDLVDSGYDERVLLSLISEHVRRTESRFGSEVLANWPAYRHQFKKIMPIEYRRVLQERSVFSTPQLSGLPTNQFADQGSLVQMITEEGVV